MHRFHVGKVALIASLVGITGLNPAYALAGDLSPARWPEPVRADLERQELVITPTQMQVVEGKAELVSSTLSPIAVHAGMDALRQGGDAADAAATVALTQIATDAGAVVSYAGISELLYYDAASKKVYALDASWGTYHLEKDPASIPGDTGALPSATSSNEQGRTTLVPGFMAGIEAMHARFGRLPFKDLFQPAIWYAEHGIIISPMLGAYFRLRQPQLWRTRDGRRFARTESGQLPRTGDRFFQPALAVTLKKVAADGARVMYTGDWGRRYVAAIRLEGGKVTLDDMARYHPVWREPMSLPFGSTTIFEPGENTDQRCPTLEALSLLNALHIDKEGPYWRDPAAFVAYAQTLRFSLYGGYLRRIKNVEHHYGFSSTCTARISPRYAAAIAPHLSELLNNLPVESAEAAHHSAAVVVIDRWGNVAALVHSINAVVWGTTGIVVDGAPIPDAASINKARLLSAKPGDRLASDMEPLIVLQRGKPIFAIATIGASLVPENVRLVGGLLFNKLALSSIVTAPTLLLNTAPGALTNKLADIPEWVPAGAYDSRMLNAFSNAHIHVQEQSSEQINTVRGTAAVGVIDADKGLRQTVEAPGVMGSAEAH